MTMTRHVALTILYICMAVVPAAAQTGKLSPWLRHITRQQRLQQTEARAAVADHRRVCAFVMTRDGCDEVLRQYGCRTLARVGNVCIADIPVGRLRRLAAEPQVVRIEARPGGQPLCDSMAFHLNARQVYEGVNLPQAFTGRGVVTGVMDIGFDLTHPTFYNADASEYRIRAFWDMLSQDTIGSTLYVGRDYLTPDEMLSLGHSRDGLDFTHGTHTLGIAAGSGAGWKYRGMAPESDICIVANAVSDDLVYIDSADVYKYTYATDALGFKYIFDYAERMGQPCVISFSEGSGQDFWGYDVLYYKMLEEMVGPGRILVAAAGNNGVVKSWFRKPAGQPSAGTFLRHGGPNMVVTLKSARPFQIRLVSYTAQGDTLVLSTADALAAEDSVLTVPVDPEGYLREVTLEAYASCYDEHETCYDLTISTSRYVGVDPRMSLEVVGSEADVEVYRVNGSFRENVLNPSLNAADCTHSIHSPGSCPAVICVGATSYRDSIENKDGEWMKYWPGHGGVRVEPSSVGPTFDGRIKPDVMAPGNNIISSYSSFYMEQHPDASDLKWDVAHFDFNGRTYAWNSNSGTSMACPAVAGVIALWLQAKPDLTPADIIDVIAHTSRHYDETLTYPNNEYGYGEIDAYAGLLYILQASSIEGLSARQSPARIALAGRQLSIAFDAPIARPLSVRLYALDGRLLLHRTVAAGAQDCNFTLPALPPAVYAVQIDGDSNVAGSALVRP